jgi:hypothetical protein
MLRATLFQIYTTTLTSGPDQSVGMLRSVWTRAHLTAGFFYSAIASSGGGSVAALQRSTRLRQHYRQLFVRWNFNSGGSIGSAANVALNLPAT